MKLNSFAFVLPIFSIKAAGHVSWEGSRRALQGPPPAPPHTTWVQQRVNHLDPLSRETWKQRVLEGSAPPDDPLAPLFVYIGGEGPLSPSTVTDGMPVEMAQRFGARLIAVEHRFYGASHPTNDSSLDSLRGLLSEAQALEDLAAVISAMSPGRRVPVVVFGCSYAGSLAAQARLKYPHLITGAVSSSSPVEARANFWQYDAAIARWLSPSCLQAAVGGLSAVEADAVELFGRAKEGGDDPPGSAGLRSLLERFGCHKMAALGKAMVFDDLVGFFYVLADAIASAVQYNRPMSQFEATKAKDIHGRLRGHKRPNEEWLLDAVCSSLESTPHKSRIEAVVEAFEIVSTRLGLSCDANEIRTSGMDTSLDSPASAERLWYFQSCAEFNYWQTASQRPMRSPHIDVQWHLRTCEHLFPSGGLWNSTGPEAPGLTNLDYGGRSIASFGAASRVHFTNGDRDPWASLSVQQAPLAGSEQDVTAFVIPGGSHCSDWAPSHPSDPPPLVSARAAIEGALRRWLRTEGAARAAEHYVSA